MTHKYLLLATNANDETNRSEIAKSKTTSKKQNNLFMSYTKMIALCLFEESQIILYVFLIIFQSQIIYVNMGLSCLSPCRKKIHMPHDSQQTKWQSARD